MDWFTPLTNHLLSGMILQVNGWLASNLMLKCMVILRDFGYNRVLFGARCPIMTPDILLDSSGTHLPCNLRLAIGESLWKDHELQQFCCLTWKTIWGILFGKKPSLHKNPSFSSPTQPKPSQNIPGKICAKNPAKNKILTHLTQNFPKNLHSLKQT